MEAAMVYYEVNEDAMRDAIKERPWYLVAWDCGWRHIKAMFVAVCPDFVYWHKLPVNATVADMI